MWLFSRVATSTPASARAAAKPGWPQNTKPSSCGGQSSMRGASRLITVRAGGGGGGRAPRRGKGGRGRGRRWRRARGRRPEDDGGSVGGRGLGKRRIAPARAGRQEDQ